MDSRLVDVGPFDRGEMAGRIRAFDWAATPLGPIARWSPALHAIVDMLLAHDLPMVLLWGPELIQIYNDSCRQILCDRHPRSLGQPTFECWPESFDVAGPIVRRARAGETVTLENARFPLARTGAVEAAWFTVTFSPVLPDEAPGGVLVTLFETTARVLADEARDAALASLREAEERQAFLLRLSDALRPMVDPSEIQDVATRLLGSHLAVSRAVYAEFAVEAGREVVIIEHEHRAPNTASFVGRHPVDQFGPDVHDLRAGRVIAVPDTEAERSTEALKEVWRALGVRARLGIPLVKQGRLVAGFGVHDAAPRPWSSGELELVAETAGRTWAAVERARAEGRLRLSEKRQTFFLQLSDALRPLADSAEMERAATRVLGEELGVNRASLAIIDADDDSWTVRHDYVDGLPSTAGRHPMSAFRRKRLPRWRAGLTSSVADSETDPTLSAADRAAYADLGVRAAVGIPLVKGGRFTALLSVDQVKPRAWTEAELKLIQEAAERTWAAIERARAEEALRESEARFAQFAASSSDALWIRDAHSLEMEYVSPAVEPIYGVPPETLLDGTQNWTALIVPEDRATALEHLEQARGGKAIVHEFRIRRPSDGAMRWIRDTDFPLHDAWGRVQRIGGIAQDVTGAKLAAERQSVLVAELQHRTRNLIAVVKGIAGDTMRETGPTEAFRAAFTDRLSALSRVQGLLSRSEVEPITIGSLLRLELDALGAGAAGGRVTAEGPEVQLRPSTVQTLALALHELATNARKHGALSHEGGRLAVTWRKRSEDGERRLAIEWVETGLERAPERPAAEKKGGGYGRELIERALPHALDARTNYALSASGVRCTIDLAVRPGKDKP